MLGISLPMALEHAALCGAQIASTRIIARLGTVSIAANSFAVTAESLCYMPGYGIGNAATTVVGQSVGARRKDLARSFNLSVILGIGVMSAMAVIMYALCPMVFALLTPDAQVRVLAAEVLRLELFAEPLYAASIVVSGALRGARDTLIPSLLNLVSIWACASRCHCGWSVPWAWPAHGSPWPWSCAWASCCSSASCADAGLISSNRNRLRKE
ncbi:MAG: MATE family efflux transporter [Merdibacter sp.]